ncbi:MAG: hypothetical protein ACRDOO_06945 [Actinomadura sp.]
MRRLAVWAGYGAVAVLALGGASPAPDAGRWSVVAEDASGAMVAARTLPPDGTFALAYEHSAYHAPAVEVFAAAGSRFTMYAVGSPNEAVLDYYAVAGTRSSASGWWLLRLEQPQVFDELPLIATPTGRRALVAGLDCVPLYPAEGAADLRIRITHDRLTGGRTEPCPPGALAAVRSAAAHSERSA